METDNLNDLDIDGRIVLMHLKKLNGNCGLDPCDNLGTSIGPL
jgi:hypothetical protein